MIAHVPTLTPAERLAASRLIELALEHGPPIRRAILFGSKARGDFDGDSDVDVLFLCDVPPDLRDDAANVLNRQADHVRAATGIAVEPWAVPVADLEPGWRTPMLIDALDDGLTLWPLGAPPIRLPFTPDDARFCAGCLLDWVAAGGSIVRRALHERRWADAALRARDDITRLAVAALLLTGDTRHRRIGSLRRFEERFVRTGLVSPRVRPALDWAAAAFPPGGGRGIERPPATPEAIATAPHGYRLATLMQDEALPLIHRLANTR
jgi:hypothetical protein